MKLKKQSGGVWVKVQDELPEDKRYPNGTPEIIVLRRNFPNEYYQYRTLTPNQISDYFKHMADADNWEWLKPFNECYVLSEDELAESYKLFMDYMIKKGSPEMSMANNFKLFIEAINTPKIQSIIQQP